MVGSLCEGKKFHVSDANVQSDVSKKVFELFQDLHIAGNQFHLHSYSLNYGWHLL